MKTKVKEQLAEIAKAIDAKQAEAQTAWDGLQTVKSGFLAKGADALADEAAFSEVDEAGKAYDTVRDELEGLKARYGRIAEMVGEDEPAGAGLFGAAAVTGELCSAGTESLGERFAKSDVYAALKASGKLDMAEAQIGVTDAVKACERADVKTLLTSGDTSAGDLLTPDRQRIMRMIPQAALNLLDLITWGATDTDLVEYVVESTRTSAAAEVAEDVAAAESALAYDIEQVAVKEIAHWIPATKRILADAGQLRTLIDAFLTDGLRRRLQVQAISGNGSGENLTGIYNSGILSQVQSTDALEVAIHKAITKVRINYFDEPRVIGIHPNDWEEIRLTRDGSGGAGTGQYLYGDPATPGIPTLWGLWPVVHTHFTENSPVVGDYSQAVLWLREGVALAVSDSHSDFFTKRKVAVLGTMRAAFGVVQPKAFCAVTAA